MNIAIVGGGAAGYFAAIRAKETCANASVTIYEKAAKPLAKVAVTGGGRCNLTNSFAGITDIKQAYPRGGKLMKRLFKVFDHRDVYQWFESRGVPLLTQEDECVFPQSQSAQSIVNCLRHEARCLGVALATGHALEHLTVADGQLFLHFAGEKRAVAADRVVIATGGHSRPGDFDYLARMGHAIATPLPSLFTFSLGDKPFRALMGTVVEHTLMSVVGTKMKSEGALLITHWGMSGPAVLRLSSYAAQWAAERQYRFDVAVNWVNERNAAFVDANLAHIISSHATKQLASIRPYDLPARLWIYLLGKTALDPEKRWGELGRKGQNKLVETLVNDIYHVEGKSRWRDEFVTCGGVALSSIHPNTLESKHVKGLFFAGEVADVDAITGGFNLQAAWTMGYVAGEHAAHTPAE